MSSDEDEPEHLEPIAARAEGAAEPFDQEVDSASERADETDAA